MKLEFLTTQTLEVIYEDLMAFYDDGRLSNDKEEMAWVVPDLNEVATHYENITGGKSIAEVLFEKFMAENTHAEDNRTFWKRYYLGPFNPPGTKY